MNEFPQDLIIFKTDSDEIQVDVKLDQDTVWLNLNQLSQIFERDKSVISRHLKNVFKEDELERNSVVANFATTAADDKTYQVEYYNLGNYQRLNEYDYQQLYEIKNLKMCKIIQE